MRALFFLQKIQTRSFCATISPFPILGRVVRVRINFLPKIFHCLLRIKEAEIFASVALQVHVQTAPAIWTTDVMNLQCRITHLNSPFPPKNRKRADKNYSFISKNHKPFKNLNLNKNAPNAQCKDLFIFIKRITELKSRISQIAIY